MSAKQEDDGGRRKTIDGTGATNNNPACDQCRTRKIRCDREAPSCSNCRKANLPCDFTNKGKRINHTKQLVEDFSFLSGRLESIDASIAKITQRLDLDSLSQAASPASNHDPLVPADDLNHFTRQSSPAASNEIIEVSRSAYAGLPGKNSFYITRNQDGSETYHGPTAGRSLFEQTRSFINDLLEPSPQDEEEGEDEFEQLKSAISNSPTTKTELRKCNETFPFANLCSGVATSSDGRLVNRPPQSFIESALDFYFEEVNTVMPLWEESHLRAMVKEQYSSPRSATTDAWNLCFNNIIVLVMSQKLKTALAMNVRRRDLEDDIFLPFLANSHRAFNILNDYSAPRLVNVQALITLAMVAAEHFPYGVFETLIHKACALGREMGLERCIERPGPGQAATALERRRVFWSLYVLDKKRTFLTGKPCDLYLAESDLETPKVANDEVWAQNALARIHMMSIYEEIWKNLYSSRAMRNSAKFREEQINRLRRYLKNWVNHHKSILDKPEQSELGTVTCMRLELRYSFHVAQILVHRCIDRPTNLQQQVNNARAALKIIADTYKSPATAGGTGLLSRLFRTYPILAFYEIHKRTMLNVDEESQEDMDLLRTCIEAMQVFKSPVSADIYFNKLGAGLEWCMNVASIIRKVQDRPQSTPAMSRTASTRTTSTALVTRVLTGKRDSEAVEDDSISNSDQRSQRRRTTPSENGYPTHSSSSGINTRETSQNGSVGPSTPASGYFTEFNNIDPFGIEQNSTAFTLSQLPTPSNELSSIQNLHIQNAQMGTMSANQMTDNKDPFGLEFAFSFPAPPGTMNPTKSTNSSPQIPSTAVSPRQSNDLVALVSKLPENEQHVLTSMPHPSGDFAPDTFSAFNTDLLDDSFNNVAQQPDMPGTHQSAFSNFSFDFASDYHGYGGPFDMMNPEGF